METSSFMKEEINMLTILRYFEDLYLEIKYVFYGEVLKLAFEKALECSKELDAEGMKYYNEVCRQCVIKREKAFNKRLELKGLY
jgi:hypothetical protein